MIIFGLLALLLASGLFSGSEISFVSANKSKSNVRARMSVPGARFAMRFFDRPEHFFTTVLVGNTIVNSAFTSLVTLALVAYGWSDTAILSVTTLMILLFGEMIPKALFRVLADLTVDAAALFIHVCYWILYPIISATKAASQLIIGLFDAERSSVASFFNKKDFAIILRESEESGVVNRQERTQISKAISLSDVLVKDVMAPRTEIVAVDESSSTADAVSLMIDRGYSKLLVFRENIDNIIGVIIGRDLFRRPASLAEIIRPIIVVPATANCSDLFRNFRLKNVSLAVAVDEFGGTAGVVTSNDILRQLLGDVVVQDSQDEPAVKRLSDGSYLIAGWVGAAEVKEQCGMRLPEGPYDTIAGYVLFTAGRIPLEREVIRTDLGIVTIVTATKTKIEYIRLKPTHADTSA
ncbi:MAG TPA: hemolysin family protein [Bacteroidota bacterium]|nr:hemolysin family protein [Bacteroidota bacterium]